MPPPKQAARQGKLAKRPHDGQQRKPSDGPPPSKKAKQNPPQSISLDASKPLDITTTSTSIPSQLPPSNAPTSDPLPSSQPQTTSSTVSTLQLSLQKTHDLTTQSIISSSQIQKKVARVLSLLSVYPTPAKEKSRVVMLYAKAGCASKMISVAEIAKREIAREGGKWFTYCAVEGVFEAARGKKKEKEKEERKGDGTTGDGGDGEEESEEEEDDSVAFETMKTPFERANEGKAKLRAVPVMSLFLSRERIETLRRAYGEQTNALPVQEKE